MSSIYYPAGVSDSDPYFDMPSVGDDEPRPIIQSIKCEGCTECLDFFFMEDTDGEKELDDAMVQASWEPRMDGIYCGRCLPFVEYSAVL